MSPLPFLRPACSAHAGRWFGFHLYVVLIFCLGLALACEASEKPVTTVPPRIEAEFHLSPFYTKYVDADGLPVLGSSRVSDAALREAANIVNHMLMDRDDIRQALIQGHVRVAVMAVSEKTTDIPEHSDLTPKAFWDARARGLGATVTRPAVSCAEENLLQFKDDPYAGENILIHEFAHTIHEMGLNRLDPQFEPRLQEAYRQAMARGCWKNTYAATNFREYWAEGVQSYFDANLSGGPYHNDINTRTKLFAYDPSLAGLIDGVFHSSTWRYRGHGR